MELELRERVKVDQAKIEDLSDSFDESTGLSWLWAFLFGPIYFAGHGFWSRFALVAFLNLFLIGFIVAPFLAYPAWKSRAKEKAERALLLDTVKQKG